MLLISLLCSLSTSPVLCSFALAYISGERNIIVTLQVTPWQTGLDPNSSMQCPNPDCTGTQKYSCAKEHRQSCKIKNLKMRQSQHCWGSPNWACCAYSSQYHPQWHRRHFLLSYPIVCFILMGQYVLLIALCSSPVLKTELLTPLTISSLLLINTIIWGLHKLLFRATEIIHLLQVGKWATERLIQNTY